MTVTSPQVSFGLYALEIKADGMPSATDVQDFANLNDLRTGNTTSRPFATYEPDFWLLDGGYKFLPDTTTDVHVGLMSLSMSDENGVFDTPPVLTINFHMMMTLEEVPIYSTQGLVLHFAEYSDDYANSITVAFYDSSGSLIRSDAYAPTSWNFATDQVVDDFKKIIITFNSTNKPYRYLRLRGIDYGELILFDGTDIRSASVVEEINLLSTEVPAGTLELTIHSDDADFSLINPAGIYAALSERQPLSVHEIVGYQSVYIGQFYLDTWENVSDTLIKFNCVDLLGVLDSQTCYGGIWLTPITVKNLIANLLEPIYAAYDLDTNLEAIEVTGWLPAGTYRQALQQIGFAIGAYVTCARSGAIKIQQSVLAEDATPIYTITKAEKGQDQSLTLTTRVTGVEVTAHNYVSTSDAIQLYNGTLAVGTYTITFTQPVHDLAITGANLVIGGVNYAIIEVTSPGTVTLNGELYIDTAQVYGVYDTTLSSTTKTNVLSITDATLVNSGNVQEITQRVYDYHQQRYLQKLRMYAPLAEVGNAVLIDTLYDAQVQGIIEKMELDLTGGFIAQAEVLGVIV